MIGYLIAYWWVFLIESLVVAGVMGLLALNADKLVGREPRSLAGLRASMIVTAAATFIAYLAVIFGVYEALGGGLEAQSLIIVAAFFSAIILGVQWLFGPYIINAAYRTRPPQTREEFMAEEMLRRIARRSGVKPPKLRIVDSVMPNAFAYGSPLAGSYVAVTTGLLRIADPGEVEAVLGHELGHLKHRDVSWILALSIIPVMIYFLGRSLLYAGLLSGNSRDRENGGPYLLLIGIALVAASVVFNFIINHFNRLREYYADAHSALTTRKPRQLQRALAKIYLSVKKDPVIAEEARSSSLAAPLFIVAPLVEMSGGFLIDIDYVIEALKNEPVNPIEELFSTHPPIPKRLRFLDRLAARGLGE